MAHSVLEQLAEPHVVVLLLAAAGLDDDAIGDRLGLPPPCVAPLLAVARAKLARAVAAPPGVP